MNRHVNRWLKSAVSVVAVTIMSLGVPIKGLSASDAPVTKSAAKPGEVRNFYEVLEDVLGDYEYDLKNGQVQGLKDLAVRNIAISENIPPSFKNHIELSVTERTLKNSRTRVIQCLACRSKKTTLSNDQMTISSPDTNPVELARIAKLSGIANFMDIAFSYQPSGMILSLTITEPDTGAIIWSRTYNSETSRAAAFRRGVDYAQIDDARKQVEYQPTVQHRILLYYLFEPNVGKRTGVLSFGYRMMERYDNRRKEVGFELNYMRDSSSLAGAAQVAGEVNLYSATNLTMLFMHSWTFIGPEENYNNIRGNLFAGIGGTYGSGFLGGLIRTGYEWRLAKHWAVNLTLGYRPPSTAFLGATSVGSVSGPEFGVGVSGLF